LNPVAESFNRRRATNYGSPSLARLRLKDMAKFKRHYATQEAEQLLFGAARQQAIGRVARRLLTRAAPE